MERRTFFKALLAGGATAVTGLLGVPAVATVVGPALGGRAEPDWVPVGPLAEFPVNEVRLAIVEVRRDDWAEGLRRRAVYVARRAVDDVVVFSRSCTDLGCPVLWDAGSSCFLCPCHGGIFSRDGEPKAGPPDRPLFRYAIRVREGTLEIDLRSVPAMV